MIYQTVDRLSKTKYQEIKLDCSIGVTNGGRNFDSFATFFAEHKSYIPTFPLLRYPIAPMTIIVVI